MTLERRNTTLGRPEIRTNETGLDFHGYATVYEEWYDVCGGPSVGGWSERVAAGAGRRTLNARPDVRLLINHDGLAIARTRSSTLTLEEDDYGLASLAPALDPLNPKVAELRSCLGRGDVDEMSFAFRVTRQEWNADYTERTIREYALDVSGSDVSIVTYPANPATVASMRSAAGLSPEHRSNAVRGTSIELAKAIALQLRKRT
jgi:uncharacterized protein